MKLYYMRGRKSYNIRNVEAHLNTFTPMDNSLEIPVNPVQNTFFLNRRMIFENNISNSSNSSNSSNIYNMSLEQQNFNSYVNAKYGVSKYASNLVSGKMYKKI